MKSRGITSLVLSILIATAIIIILVGTYAAFTFTGGAGNATTCSISPATFAVLQNSTTTYISYPIPAEPCQHKMTLSGFSLNTAGETSQIPLSGTIHISSKSQLTGLLVYLDGTYEVYSPMSLTGETCVGRAVRR